MSNVQYSTTHTIDTKQSTPEIDTTKDDLKQFLDKLAERRERFCDHCKVLVSEALS